MYILIDQLININPAELLLVVGISFLHSSKIHKQSCHISATTSVLACNNADRISKYLIAFYTTKSLICFLNSKCIWINYTRVGLFSSHISDHILLCKLFTASFHLLKLMFSKTIL